MLYSYIFIYIIGAILYFTRTSLVVINKVRKILKKDKVSDEVLENVIKVFIEKIIFQIIMMLVFPITFYLYNTYIEYVGENIFVSTGIITLVWLVLTGIIVKVVYFALVNGLKSFKVFSFSFPDLGLLWISGPIIYGILNCIHTRNVNQLLLIISIVLGKYLWMDTIKRDSIGDMLSKAGHIIKDNNISIFLIFYQMFVMSYLLIFTEILRKNNMDVSYMVFVYITLAFICSILDRYLQKLVIQEIKIIINKV